MKKWGSGQEKMRLTAAGVRRADHATLPEFAKVGTKIHRPAAAVRSV
jgi:hypothetical protein